MLFSLLFCFSLLYAWYANTIPIITIINAITDNIVYKATGSTLSKYIEIIDTKLTKKIKVEFRKKYKERPKIIINIDGNYESLYKNYSLFFDSYTEYVEVPIEETESIEETTEPVNEKDVVVE